MNRCEGCGAADYHPHMKDCPYKGMSIYDRKVLRAQRPGIFNDEYLPQGDWQTPIAEIVIVIICILSVAFAALAILSGALLP